MLTRTGVGSLVTGGSLAVGLGVAGLVATSFGFFQQRDEAGRVDREALADAIANSDLAKQLTVLLAFEHDLIDTPAGTSAVLVSSSPGRSAVRMEPASGETITIEIGEKGWFGALEKEFTALGAWFMLAGERRHVHEAVVDVAAIGITDGRFAAFDATSGLNTPDDEQEEEDAAE